MSYTGKAGSPGHRPGEPFLCSMPQRLNVVLQVVGFYSGVRQRELHPLEGMAIMTIRDTREAWLERAIDALRPRFIEIGLPLPERIHVSVGFGYGAKSESAIMLGQCWARAASEDEVNHVFVSPEVHDTAMVLMILLHELIHAADNCESGHKGRFAEAAVRLGFEGKMLDPEPSIELAVELMCLAETLGEYPHGALHPARVQVAVAPNGSPTPGRLHSGPRKQSTRMLKVMCPICGYTARTTAKWLEVGNPRCPAGDEMLPQL